jgi:beta-glucanase (GH16 family)
LPDKTKWDFEEGYLRNGEAQYFARNRSENARVENGMLIIEARRDFFNDSAYSSASLNTFNKEEFLYGRIEMSAKLPYGKGVWPFDKPQYIILNLAIGGSWGGQYGVDTTIFPQQYVIDYVRVYR